MELPNFIFSFHDIQGAVNSKGREAGSFNWLKLIVLVYDLIWLQIRSLQLEHLVNHSPPKN